METDMKANRRGVAASVRNGKTTGDRLKLSEARSEQV